MSNVTVTEGIDSFAVFAVNLSNRSTSPVDLSLALADGTASGSGVDYGAGLEVSTDNGATWAAVSVATIAANTDGVLVRTPIQNDPLDEPAEAFTLTATVTSGTTINAMATGTATINDNDPTPTLSIDDVTVNEAAGTITFTVNLSAASGQTVTVNYTTNDGSATGADYVGGSGMLTFVPTVIGQSVTLPVTNDAIFENGESFTVTLSGAVNATIADGAGVGTIRDDGTGQGGTDNDTPSFAVSSTAVGEGDGFAEFTISLSNESTTPVTFNLALVNGSATGAGADFGTGGAGNLQVFVGGVWTDATTATIPAGSTSVQVRTPITDDTLDENAEAFTLTATRSAGTTTNAAASGTATITDNDPAPTLSIDDVTVNEGAGTVTFTVTLSTASGLPVSVNYALASDTATAGDDFVSAAGTLNFAAGVTSRTITVSILNDALFESSESFSVTLNAPVNATIADDTGTGTILDDGTGPGGTDNDAPTLRVSDVTVMEGSDSFATFTVSLSNLSTSDVSFSLALANGTATGDGTDYGTAGAGNLQVFVGGSWVDAASATIPAGTLSVQVRTPITDDTVPDSGETFTLTATRTSGATTNASATGTGTIFNEDVAPSISIDDVTVNENAGTVTFTVTLSSPSSVPVSVDYSMTDGTAGAADYTASSGRVVFAVGVTTQTITVPITNDLLDELDETFTVNLSNPTNATIADATAVGTITDDDPAPSLNINDVTVNEQAGTVTFTVTLSAPSGLPVSVNYATTNGTATDADYTTKSGTLNFAPGVTTQTITVAITDDRVFEGNESFTITLSGATNATIRSGGGTGTITDEEDIRVPQPEPEPFIFAYDVYHDFATEDSALFDDPVFPGMLTHLQPIDVTRDALLPLAPIYSGEADPGATLVIEIYNANGVRIGSQTVLADAGGNWLANFATATLKDAPSDVRITQVSAPYSFGETTGHNLRTYYSPTALSPGHFLSQTIKNSMLSEEAPLLGGLDLANPIQLGSVKYGAEMLPSEGVAAGQ